MSALIIMQAAVSSVNWALNVKRSLLKKSIDFFRSFTGRLTKIFRVMCSPLEIIGTPSQQYVEREKAKSTGPVKVRYAARRENTVPSFEES
jgi:hypothetical protein